MRSSTVYVVFALLRPRRKLYEYCNRSDCISRLSSAQIMLPCGARIPSVRGRQRGSIMHALSNRPLYMMNSAVPVHLLTIHCPTSGTQCALVQSHSRFMLQGDAAVQSDEQTVPYSLWRDLSHMNQGHRIKPGISHIIRSLMERMCSKQAYLPFFIIIIYIHKSHDEKQCFMLLPMSLHWKFSY